jgi:Recombination endonuclease VII
MCYDNRMIIIKCRQCKQDRQDNEFDIFRGRKNKTCRECRVKNNLWYSQDLDGRKTRAKSYYQNIKGKVAQYRSDLRLKRKYSLSREEWNKMLVSQNNKCLLCDCDFTKIKPCVDHNHQTGKIRGLLCRECNLSLGVIEDIVFMQRANLYLDSKK